MQLLILRWRCNSLHPDNDWRCKKGHEPLETRRLSSHLSKHVPTVARMLRTSCRGPDICFGASKRNSGGTPLKQPMRRRRVTGTVATGVAKSLKPKLYVKEWNNKPSNPIANKQRAQIIRCCSDNRDAIANPEDV